MVISICFEVHCILFTPCAIQSNLIQITQIVQCVVRNRHNASKRSMLQHWLISRPAVSTNSGIIIIIVGIIFRDTLRGLSIESQVISAGARINKASVAPVFRRDIKIHFALFLLRMPFDILFSMSRWFTSKWNMKKRNYDSVVFWQVCQCWLAYNSYL